MIRKLLLLGALSVAAPTKACQETVANQVVISFQGQILWNGSEIDRLTLVQYITIAGTMNPPPRLVFDYATGANCGIVRNVARTIVLNPAEAIRSLEVIVDRRTAMAASFHTAR